MDMDKIALIDKVEMSDTVREQINAVLDERGILPDNRIVVDSDTTKPVTEDMAEMERAAILDSVADIKIFGVPIGQAAAGGLSAMVISALIDYVAKPVREKLGTRWGDAGLKAAAAWGVNKYLKGFMGKDATMAATIILSWEAFESAVPEITTWVYEQLPAPSGLTTPPGYSQPAQLPAGNTSTPMTGQSFNYYPEVSARYG